MLEGRCIHHLLWLPKTSLVCTFPCLLSLPPTNLECSASFLSHSVPSMYRVWFWISPRKLPSLQINSIVFDLVTLPTMLTFLKSGKDDPMFPFSSNFQSLLQPLTPNSYKWMTSIISLKKKALYPRWVLTAPTPPWWAYVSPEILHLLLML